MCLGDEKQNRRIPEESGYAAVVFVYYDSVLQVFQYRFLYH